MNYHFSKIANSDFDQTMNTVKGLLGDAGFGILSEIDVSAKLREKLGANFRKYRILGACNPAYAHEALKAEPYIGTMLPCNVVIQEWEDGRVEVSAIDPVASMQAVDNPDLVKTAREIRDRLQNVIADL